MKHRHALKAIVASFALVLTLALTGCELPFELPFDLDGILEPIDEFFTPTSVEEAQADRRSSRTPMVTTPAIREEGVLTVGIRTNSSIPPLVIETGGAVTGIDIDVASAIADQMGLSVRFVEVNDVDGALANTCDIVMGTAPGETSSTVVGLYVETGAALFHRGEATTVTADDLLGATVGLQDGSVSQRVLSLSNSGLVETTFANLNDAFDALEAGTVNYVLCDAYPGAYLASLYNDIAFAGTLDVCSPIGIAVAADNTTLQSSVQAAYDSVNAGGVVNLIRSKWIGGMPAITPDNQVQGIELFDNQGMAQANTRQAPAPGSEFAGTWIGSAGGEEFFILTLEEDGTATFVPNDAHYYDFYNQDGTWEYDGTTLTLYLSRGDKALEVDGDTLVGAGSDFGVSAYGDVTFSR